MSKLLKVQTALKAPKSRYNNFGGYNYRSLEDILDAVKPLLLAEGLVLTIHDEVVQVGDRVYVKAVATLTDGKETYTASALAREAETKKGMDESQITGTASSYARKYCLNGLFLIDDTKDADTDEHQKQTQTADDDKKWLSEGGDGVKGTTQEEFIKVEKAVREGRIAPKDLRRHYKVGKKEMEYFDSLVG